MTKQDILEEEIEESPVERINLDALSTKPKRNAWKYARDLENKKTAQFIDPERVYELAQEFKNTRDRAFFSLLYLTAARIEEVTRYKKIRWGKKRVLLIKEGSRPKAAWIQDYKKRKEIGGVEFSIRREDIEERTEENKKCVVFRLRNLKNKRRGENIKLIPITLDNELNMKFYKLIKDYLAILEDWEELFPFGKRNGERIINQIKWNPHFIRKVRLTHLARKNRLSEQELRILAGWTDTRPSKYYVELSWRDLINKL